MNWFSVKDQTFVFTGKFRMVRKEAQAYLESKGGIPLSSLTRGTDYLVVGEDPGSKVAKAKSYGVSTISEKDFFNILSQTSDTQQNEEEIPLPPDEVAKILSRLVDSNCPRCGTHSRVWDWMEPNTECATCRLQDQSKQRKEHDDFFKMPEGPMSFQDPDVATDIWYQCPEAFVQPSSTCTHCGTSIPYSTSKSHYYCFNCHHYSGGPKIVLSKHPGHYHIFPDSNNTQEGYGRSSKCVSCGSPVFFTLDEADRLDESNKYRDYHNSVEFLAKVLAYYSGHLKVDRILSKNIDPIAFQNFARTMAQNPRKLALYQRE